MTQEEIAQKLQIAEKDRLYKGQLTPYSVQSIEEAKSNYPVANLIQYCQDKNIQMIIIDKATEDSFTAGTILDVHKVINLLMNRYEIDPKLIYRKTGVYYTPPKSLVQEDLDKLKANGVRFTTPLSIKTLLAVCEVIHCDILFQPK